MGQMSLEVQQRMELYRHCMNRCETDIYNNEQLIVELNNLIQTNVNVTYENVDIIYTNRVTAPTFGEFRSHSELMIEVCREYLQTESTKNFPFTGINSKTKCLDSDHDCLGCHCYRHCRTYPIRKIQCKLQMFQLDRKFLSKKKI